MKTGFLGSVPVCSIPKDLDKSVSFYNSCDAAISQIVIGPNGDCRPCVEMPWSGGNILTRSIESIWKSKVFEDIRLFNNVPPECYECRFVSSCHGGCRASAYNLTKSIRGKSHFMPDILPPDIFLSKETISY
jgi:radical SAM protein with 4Fe4S-binding SPASM domain